MLLGYLVGQGDFLKRDSAAIWRPELMEVKNTWWGLCEFGRWELKG